MSMSSVAAVDLGAESGRVMLASLDGGRLRLKEVHRFPNTPIGEGTDLRWDARRLFDEIRRGLQSCSRESRVEGIGVDTWGVDFALLGKKDEPLGNPFHYRNPRTDGIMDKAFALVPRGEIFERTGIQFLPINTIYMLLSLKGSSILEKARTFLTMPDLFNFRLTGRKVCEFTNATTTQLYDQRAGDWAREMIERLGLPSKIFPEVVPPGTILGTTLPETGLGEIPVIAPACHDTGSAVAAVPAASKRFAYISSGTWSLVGIETAHPIVTAASLAGNFTNEGGVRGTVRFLKNVMGLWIVQECRRAWEREGTALTYDEITRLAEQAPPFGPLIDPDSTEFLRPGDMPSRMIEFCRRTGQTPPATRGAMLRCIIESLALAYRRVTGEIETITGVPIEIIHIVGGGSRNRLLCRLTAEAARRPVIAGPVEATAIGNALIQHMALGRIASLAEGREIVRRSSEVEEYNASPNPRWDAAQERFEHLLKA